MKKVDLEELTKEATAKGLNASEIDHMRRHYFTAMIRYEDTNKPKGHGVTAALRHLEMMEFVAYAAAKQYINKTIDEIQKGNK